ncbi:LexA family protein [Rufibacter quisquiliarum]|uniref:DNA polymerase V n=1 Tax=Rufibacter quisquiliarum TaxID=1549639 RepID=A0A839GQ08_9BACT|nr:S24 family peptidase [Rufibacter quisquiliarum]MBA9076966.1 DNA polymerase V [Rufibacter quisquiliarum]
MLIDQLYTPDLDDEAAHAVQVKKFMPTGFPSPAANYMGDFINLNEYLNIRAASCFLARVSGNGMAKAGIHANDLLVIDRALPLQNQCLVLATLEEEFVVRRYCEAAGRKTLETDGEPKTVTELASGSEFAIWGVVSWVVHRCLPEAKTSAVKGIRKRTGA